MIAFHLIDDLGVYFATVEIDPDEKLPGRGTTSAPPDIPDGQFAVWNGTWSIVEERPVSPYDLEGAKAAKKLLIEDRLNVSLTGGFTVPATVSSGLGGKVLQTRNIEDRTNWLTSQATYSSMVAAGQGGAMGAMFRTEDNATVSVTVSEGLAVLLAMAAWGAALMAASWELKDAVTAAETAEDLDAVDIESGYGPAAG